VINKSISSNTLIKILVVKHDVFFLFSVELGYMMLYSYEKLGFTIFYLNNFNAQFSVFK